MYSIYYKNTKYIKNKVEYIFNIICIFNIYIFSFTFVGFFWESNFKSRVTLFMGNRKNKRMMDGLQFF